jgi:hypothetical protein
MIHKNSLSNSAGKVSFVFELWKNCMNTNIHTVCIQLACRQTVWIQIHIQSVYSLRVGKLVTTFRVPSCLSPWIRRLWEQVQVCEQVMDCRRDWLIDHCTCIRSKAKCWLPPFLKKEIKLGLWDLVLYVCGVFVCVPHFNIRINRLTRTKLVTNFFCHLRSQIDAVIFVSKNSNNMEDARIFLDKSKSGPWSDVIDDVFGKILRSWDLRSSRILRSVEWYFVTDVSGQAIGSHLQGLSNPRRIP